MIADIFTAIGVITVTFVALVLFAVATGQAKVTVNKTEEDK